MLKNKAEIARESIKKRQERPAIRHFCIHARDVRART